MKAISLFKTKTFWGVVFLFLTICLTEYRTAIVDHDFSSEDLLSVIIAIAGTALSLTGRMDSHGKVAYTPEGLPGRNQDVAERLANR